MNYTDGVIQNGSGDNATFSTLTTVNDGVGQANASVQP